VTTLNKGGGLCRVVRGGNLLGQPLHKWRQRRNDALFEPGLDLRPAPGDALCADENSAGKLSASLHAPDRRIAQRDEAFAFGTQY
jgi:hypothetical protein